MNVLRAVELLNEHAICPKCGSDKVGSGAGTLEITTDTFTRSCKCGFTIVVKDGEENE